jgi:transcription elongation factor Elf1
MIQTLIHYNINGFETLFSGFKVSETAFIKKPVTQFLIDYKGIIRENNPSCPHCKSNLVVCNGYTSYDNKLFSSLNLKIRAGQYKCNSCGCHYLLEIPEFTELSNEFREFLRSFITSLRLRNNSFPDISEILQETFGYLVTEEYIRQIFEEVSVKIYKITTYLTQSGYYAYDAQYLKINGRQFYRHVVHDLITGKVLIDIVLPKQNKKTIKHLFLTTIKAESVKAFVVDMAGAYPGIIEECYGKKVHIQWCHFHLFQDIGRKYKGCKKETEDSGFQNELNKQLLFDIIYPRPELVNFLKKILNWLRIKRDKLKHLDEKILTKGMKKCRAYFWKEYRMLQNKRKQTARKSGYKIIRDEKKLARRFNKIYDERNIYPKKIQKVIQKIKDNWKKVIPYLRYLNIPPTNNVCERYFAKTCRKTEKKLFRSVEAALLKCKIHFLQENGTEIYKPYSIFTIVSNHKILFDKCNLGIT